jgi:tetratricopeptide (TPR) repeat protein
VLAYTGLAEAYLQAYESTKQPAWIDKAETASQTARKLDPELAAVHITFGLIHRARGRYDEAIRELSEVLAHDPRNADAHNYLAMVYEGAGRLPEAEELFKEAIDLRPSYWKAFDSLGKFYLRRGRNDDAAKMFQRAIDLAPDNARALANLGAVYIRTRQVEKAEEQLIKSLAIHPTFGAYNNLGYIYFQQGHYAKSVPMFENAVRLGGANSSLLNGLAEAYKATPGMEQKAPEKFREALLCAEHELEVNPNDADARARLAWIYAETGQPKKAIAQANQALKQAPSNVDVVVKCMLAYELSGQRTRALDAFAAANRNGYLVEEVRNWPEFAALRQDPTYVARLEGETKR